MKKVSVVLIYLDELEVGEKYKGLKPHSLKYGCRTASLAIMRSLGKKHNIFYRKL